MALKNGVKTALNFENHKNLLQKGKQLLFSVKYINSNLRLVIMDVSLYIKEGEKLKMLKVPKYVVRDLLRDRLSNSDIERINDFSKIVSEPSEYPVGSVVIEFSSKKATCFRANIDLRHLEPTWNVENKEVGLMNWV